jgi:MFS family permease
MRLRFPDGLRALNHRNYRLFFLGQLVSLIGTWMQSVGQSWLVLELTQSPFKLGMVGAVQFLPMLLFALVGGAVVDRLHKRRLLIVTQSVLMLLAFVLSALVWSGLIQYWHILTLAAILGVVNTLDMPARQAFVVDLAGKDDLVNAIALNSAMFNGARIIGPAVAGALVARYGAALAFTLNGASFIAVIAALMAIQAEGAPQPRRQTTVLQEIAEGVRYVLRTPAVFLVLSLLMVVSVFVLNWNVLVPLLTKEVLHLEATGFGVLMSCLGAGALAGSVGLALLGKSRPLLPVVQWAAVIVSAAAFGMGFVHQYWLAAAVLFLIGIAQILFSASCNTTVQMSTPDALRGRVMSIYSLVFAGVAPIGSFSTGIITEALGALAGFRIGGGLGLMAVLGLLTWWALRRPRKQEPDVLGQRA